MVSEYMKKARSFVTWLIPFFMAVFLLFGCGSAQTGQGSPVPGGNTETAAEVLSENISESFAEAEIPDVQLQSAIESSGEESQQAIESFREESQPAAESELTEASEQEGQTAIAEDGSYTSKEEVALYIHTYGRLPDNFITKKDAEALGWVSREGNLWEVAPGMSIGGSRFGNYEGQLPDEKGRKWYECDINFDGTYRGAERIVYSNDGLIYYTGDHYESFEQLY